MTKHLTEMSSAATGLTAADWRALVAQHPVRFRVTGHSMHPTLKHAESLLIEPLTGKPAAGEVVVYLRDGRLIVHRCLRDGRLRGDGRLAVDAPVAAEDIIGVVRRIGRNGQQLKVGRLLPVTTRYYRFRLKMQLEIGRTVKGCLRLLWRSSSPILNRFPSGRQMITALKNRSCDRPTAQPDNTTGKTVRIGSLRVLLGLPVPAEFVGLSRLPLAHHEESPKAAGATRPALFRAGPVPLLSKTIAAPVRIDLKLMKTADWPTGLRRSADRFTKGLATHVTEMSFSERLIQIRMVQPVTAAAVYRVMRDVFCGLGGLSGEVLLHGATALHQGQAVVFCAASGGGKSTIAGLLAPTVEIINDEIIWIRRNPAGHWLAINQGFWSLPPSAAPAEIPVRAVYLLEKADDCRIVPANPDAVFAQLLTAPFGGHEPLLPARARQTAQFLKSIPLYRLYFTRDAAALNELLFQPD